MEQTEPTPTRESVENNSSKKVVFYLSDTQPDNKAAGYLGEFYIVKGELKVKARSEHEENLLLSRLRDIWMPQQGFPVLKKDNGGFARNERGKLVIDKYVLPTNAPDEFIEAIYDYTRALGVFKVDLSAV